MSLRKFLDNLALLLCSSVICLVAGLLILEWTSWSKLKEKGAWHDAASQFDSELGWAPLPNHKAANWGGVETNSMGFRSTEINPELNSIAVFGDSVAWGHGVDNDHTFPRQLEKQLNNQGTQVVNLAVSGYGIDQYYLFMKRNLAKLPNLKLVVMVVYNNNDFLDTTSNARWGKRKPLYVRDGDSINLTEVPIWKYCLRNLISKSNFIATFPYEREKFVAYLNSVAGDISLSREEGQFVVKELFAKIHSLAQEHNVEILFVLSPSRAEASGSATEDYRWIDSVLENNKFWKIDFLSKTRSTELQIDQLYYDSSHYSAQGNKLLADSVAAEINKYFTDKKLSF